MHDLKQLTKDATGILAPDFYIEARVGRENHRGDCVRALSYWASRNERADELLKRLAAFVRDLTDETEATPDDCHKYGIDAYLSLSGDTVAQFGDNEHYPFRVSVRTRGQLFALAMGLQLREGEG